MLQLLHIPAYMTAGNMMS